MTTHGRPGVRRRRDAWPWASSSWPSATPSTAGAGARRGRAPPEGDRRHHRVDPWPTTPAELAHRYAVALDRKDYDDAGRPVRARHPGQGPGSSWSPPSPASGVTVLSVTTQVVDPDPDDPDRATGTVYCTAEVEDPDHGWIRQSIVYLDRYERHDGEWYFRARDHQLVYGEGPRLQPPRPGPRQLAGLPGRPRHLSRPGSTELRRRRR